jgi:cell division transport system permease protein
MTESPIARIRRISPGEVLGHIRIRRQRERAGPIVPARSISGRALAAVVGIMSFLACLTVGAVALVTDASHDWSRDIGREVTIQVMPVDGTDTDAAVAQAVALAEASPGVAAVRPLGPEENAALLEPWLGTGIDLDDLPIPRLIVVTVGDASLLDLTELGDQLRQQVAGASLDDHRAWTARLRTMANATVLFGLGILALVFAATALSVVFATRGAMVGNRDIVSVLHLVGAEDRFIAREFQRHFLGLGLRGSLAGALAAALLFVLLGFLLGEAPGTPEAEQAFALFGRFAIGPAGYLGALVVALLIAGMTAVTSRLAVFRFLSEME